MAGEIQTITAAFEIARLTWKACVFLKRVKDADRALAEIYERATRLDQVLNGLTLALTSREQKGLAPRSTSDLESAERIRRCILASGKILREVERKVGGFENESASDNIALLERVKIACRHPGIVRLQTDLDARVQALQTELSILQLSDHAHTHETIGTNHQEVIEELLHLKEQLNSGNKLLYTLLREHRHLSKPRPSFSGPEHDQAIIDDNDADAEAIENLADCLHIAEELHERYTSEYAPDDRSIRFHRGILSEQGRNSPLIAATPVTEESGSIPLAGGSGSLTNLTLSDTHDEDEDDDVWPLEILNRHIDEYKERADNACDQGHYNQAEVNLQAAIKASETRERHYDVKFNDRVRLLEEVAICYQNQHRWAEAVSRMHQLLRDSSDELVQARQNHILASIYYDRHLNQNGPALANATEDIEFAEKHAKRAFIKRYAMYKADNLASKDLDRYYSCIQLFRSILETRGKTVEANDLATLLPADGISGASESLRRPSTTRAPTDILIIEDKPTQLISAIHAHDSDTVQSLLSDEEVDVEQLCPDGKTPLMHAVEIADETIVHKLLDRAVGADVNTTNKKGLTALHFAASAGSYDMVRCLLHHDADIEARDKRGETPLMKAVQNDQSIIVQILSDAGADLDTKNADEYSLLHYSIRLSRTDISKQLLDIHPELKDCVDKAGKTALHYCADLERVEQATALLTHSNHADVNAIDSFSRSPLYFAASKPPTERREAMVKLLVHHGGHVDESRPPPRYRDYAALRPRRISRHDSISTTGSIGTTSTGVTRLSRIFSGRMHMRS